MFFASAVAWFNDEFNSILVDIHFCFLMRFLMAFEGVSGRIESSLWSLLEFMLAVTEKGIRKIIIVG